MKNKKLILAMWIVSFLPALLLLLAWSRLPDRVPMQWGFDGQVNSYGGKGSLWIVAGMAPLLCPVLQFLPKIDPKKENYQRFQAVYDGFAPVLPLFFTVMMALVLSETLHPGSVNMGRVVMVFISVLFMGIGCIMGKIKPNWFMGIRTPWALSDPDVWNRTHRLGGWVFFLSGLMELPLALWAPEAVMAGALVAFLFGGIAVTYFMSWKWFRDKTTPPKD